MPSSATAHEDLPGNLAGMPKDLGPLAYHSLLVSTVLFALTVLEEIKVVPQVKNKSSIQGGSLIPWNKRRLNGSAPLVHPERTEVSSRRSV